MIKNEYTYNISDGGHVACRVQVSGRSDGKKYSVRFDIASKDIITKHKWTIQRKGSHYQYAVCTCHRELMHRLVTKAKRGYVVDHINHDGLDNTLRNLRVVTHAQNMRNRKPNTNASYNLPVPGLYYNGASWGVRIKKNGTQFNKNGFDDLNEAICYRIRREYELNPNDCPNYRTILSKIPRKLLLIYFPEIYGSRNHKFIGSAIFNAHYKRSKHKDWIEHVNGVRKVGTNV